MHLWVHEMFPRKGHDRTSSDVWVSILGSNILSFWRLLKATF